MSDIAIQDLPELLPEDVAEDDVVLVSDTSTGLDKKMSISAFAALLMPSGFIMDFAGDAAPTGYLVCDGSEVSRATYATLYTAIGDTWGDGDGSTTFNLPDLTGKFTVGQKDADTDFGDVADSGGEKVVTLTIDQIPTHNHAGSTSTDGAHTHQMRNAGTTGGGYGLRDALNATSTGMLNTGSSGSHSHSVTTENKGGGQSHNNLPPFGVVLKVIKS